jgi:hypothetical protein
MARFCVRPSFIISMSANTTVSRRRAFFRDASLASRQGSRARRRTTFAAGKCAVNGAFENFALAHAPIYASEILFFDPFFRPRFLGM